MGQEMDRDLQDLIKKFNDAQEFAVNILETEFYCPRPESAMDFITRCKQAISDKSYQSDSYKIRPHGKGMEFGHCNLKIDFDFGENGEITGFDSWRLFNFVMQNKIKPALNTEWKIKTAVAQAIYDGLIYKGNGMDGNHYVSS